MILEQKISSALKKSRSQARTRGHKDATRDEIKFAKRFEIS